MPAAGSHCKHLCWAGKVSSGQPHVVDALRRWWLCCSRCYTERSWPATATLCVSRSDRLVVLTAALPFAQAVCPAPWRKRLRLPAAAFK